MPKNDFCRRIYCLYSYKINSKIFNNHTVQVAWVEVGCFERVFNLCDSLECFSSRFMI